MNISMPVWKNMDSRLAPQISASFLDLIFAHSSLIIDAMIKDLQKDFSLVPEENVEAFLGIQICRTGDRIEFTQPGQIDRNFNFMQHGELEHKNNASR